MATHKALVLSGTRLVMSRIERPTLMTANDVIVRVKAAGLNYVDYKMLSGARKAPSQSQSVNQSINHLSPVLGFDAAGVIESVGSNVTSFKPGDEVFYAGDSDRQGSMQQYQCVDAHLIARKPESLTFEEAAAMPCTSITAWEGMKEMLQVKPNESILVTAGASGVGSMAIQLAKLWGLQPIIATASRRESADWARSFGAHHVINHSKNIVNEFKSINQSPVCNVFNVFSDKALIDLVQVMAYDSKIVGVAGDLSADHLPAFKTIFSKRIRFLSEHMFGKTMYNVKLQSQGDILKEVSVLVDQGKLRTTLNTAINWSKIDEAMIMLESRTTIGKIVITID